MGIYFLRITDEPKARKYFRYGLVKKIIYKNGDVIEGDQMEVRKAGKPRLEEDVQNLERIILEIHYQKRATEPYPNFLQVRFALCCADSEALGFLDSHNIHYKTVSAKTNSDRNYSLIFFNEHPGLLDLQKSNLYVDHQGFAKTNSRDYFSPVESKLVLKSKVMGIKGIVGLRELGFLICDEETKRSLEKSKLTGFAFEELQVVGN